jgi:hypothetical protein
MTPEGRIGLSHEIIVLYKLDEEIISQYNSKGMNNHTLIEQIHGRCGWVELINVRLIYGLMNRYRAIIRLRSCIGSSLSSEFKRLIGVL